MTERKVDFYNLHINGPFSFRNPYNLKKLRQEDPGHAAYVDFCIDLVAFMRENNIAQILDASKTGDDGEHPILCAFDFSKRQQLSWGDIIYDVEKDVGKIKECLGYKITNDDWPRFKFVTQAELEQKQKAEADDPPQDVVVMDGVQAGGIDFPVHMKNNNLGGEETEVAWKKFKISDISEKPEFGDAKNHPKGTSAISTEVPDMMSLDEAIKLIFKSNIPKALKPDVENVIVQLDAARNVLTHERDQAQEDSRKLREETNALNERTSGLSYKLRHTERYRKILRTQYELEKADLKKELGVYKTAMWISVIGLLTSLGIVSVIAFFG